MLGKKDQRSQGKLRSTNSNYNGVFFDLMGGPNATLDQIIIQSQ